MPRGQKLIPGIAALLFILSLASPCLPQSPDDPVSTDAVRITSGPIVEEITDTTATIAWSTNVNAGTTLRYGTEPDQLDLTANMPWGGYTHRVYLKGLKPGTTYFFQAESAEGQGTGTKATAAVDRFQTRSLAPKSTANQTDLHWNQNTRDGCGRGSFTSLTQYRILRSF